MRVLVVEDDAVLAEAIARGLRQHAMSVDVAGDGTGALERSAVTRYDVVVLDRDLPGVHGDEVCRQLAGAGDGSTRILMLTAAATVRDRVAGLNLGADDYLPKPFAFDELVADALRPVLGRQERLVDGLLALAWSEHGTATIEPVRLDNLVHTALSRAGEPPVTIDTDLGLATVPGDPILLDLLVDNLIRNAIRHNVPGGQVWIRVDGHTLTVENTGELLTTERLAELSEPFRRGTRDRVGGNGGAGLGLAIVSAVARAHHGQLDLTPRPGGGIRAEVRFPGVS